MLWIKEDEPDTLYCHLAEPNIEGEAQDEIVMLTAESATASAFRVG